MPSLRYHFLSLPVGNSSASGDTPLRCDGIGIVNGQAMSG
jgi:hypothetical protein